MTFFQGKFCNIRTVKNKDCATAYQPVIAGWQGPVFSTKYDHALRDALLCRNKAYIELNTTHGALLKRHASGTTNYCLVGGGGGREKESPAYQVSIRNLRTGRSCQKAFTFDKHGGGKKAHKAALLYLLENNEAYNQLVDTFNQCVIQDAIAIAEKEAQTLKPQLQKLKQLSEERWRNIFYEKWPNGLTDDRIPE